MKILSWFKIAVYEYFFSGLSIAHKFKVFINDDFLNIHSQNRLLKSTNILVDNYVCPISWLKFDQYYLKHYEFGCHL